MLAVEDLGDPDQIAMDDADASLYEKDELLEDDEELILDEAAEDFLNTLIDKVIVFCEALSGIELRPYQLELGRRIVRSIILADGEVITALFSRQSGKSETVSIIVSGIIVLFPKLAEVFKVLERFKNGVWIGVFAPVEGQSEFVYGRIVDKLTSDNAKEMLSDPEIDIKVDAKSRILKLSNGSLIRRQTANPKAKVEGATYHMVVIDEAQSCDDLVVSKSISPMLASTAGCLPAGTRVLCEDGLLRDIEEIVLDEVDIRVLAPTTENLSDSTLVPRRIEAYHNNGTKPCIRLCLRGGREIISTHNHHFMVARNLRSNRNSWEWVRADKILPRDRIAVPWQPYEVAGVSIDTPLPELLGWIISEGCLTGDRRGVLKGSIEIAQTKPHLVQDITDLIQKFDPSLTFNHAGRRGRVIGGGQGSRTPNSLKAEMIRMDLWGKGAAKKRIPAEVFGWDNASVARLLSRLYAGDGCIYNGNVQIIKYTTISRGLVEDLQMLLDRFGIYSTFNTSVTQVGNPQFDIVISDPTSQIRFLQSIPWVRGDVELDVSRSNKHRTDLGLRYEMVAEIEDAGELPTYDIQVEASHCYVANGVVSHNTTVKIGTPSFHKGNFFRDIQYNKRRGSSRRASINHFEADWKVVSKYNPYYEKFIKQEKNRIGEDSDEFQMSYALRWQLGRGMLITDDDLDYLADKSMGIVRSWHSSPVVVGIDPARTHDSTVVTVVWVDWENPDAAGYMEHRILNWLELNNTDWESQYFEIVDFLANYDVAWVAVDKQGMGDPVAERLSLLLGHRCEVVAVGSDVKAQTERWTHLIQLLQRGMIVYPGHSKARRTRLWKRFRQQMEDAEKQIKGQYMLVAAPDDSRSANDDFVDSLALACVMSKNDSVPEVETMNSPFYG